MHFFRASLLGVAVGALVASPGPSLSAQQPSTPPIPASVSNFYPFRIGALQAFALRDGMLPIPNDGSSFAVRTPAEVSPVLSAAGLPTDHFEFSIQPLLVREGSRVLLFDTGLGTGMGGGGGRLVASMAAAGLDPASVTDIFISHSHGDHIGGFLSASGAPNFPNARVHMSAAEWAGLSQRAAAPGASAGGRATVAWLRDRVVPFQPGAVLVPGVVRAVEIRGHTPGHSAYRITSGRDSLLFVGDSMHHYILSPQHPDWPIAFDTDRNVAMASRRALMADLARSGQRIYSGHFPFPGLGRITRRGNAFAWVPETN